MTPEPPYRIDPRLDLVLERVVDVPPALVWAAWTRPEHVVKWFTPAPWTTTDCEIDLRPGGRFYTVMRSPEGDEYPNTGCYLEVVENQRLIWTSVLGPGWRPAVGAAACPGEDPGFHMTGVIELEPHDDGTKYTAIALHGDETTRVRHEEMGFQEGWGTALDQLVEYVRGL